MGKVMRSEERRVGKECRSRWWPEHEKKKRVHRDKRQLRSDEVETPASTAFVFFFFKQKTAYEIGLGIPAEPLFRSRPRRNGERRRAPTASISKESPAITGVVEMVIRRPI